jgi:hypothetical protein
MTEKRETVICRHQDRLINKGVAEAKALGKMLQITEAMRVQTGTETIASIDATPEQHDQWTQQFIRLLFYAEGTRCAKCGHIATGPLTEFSPEEAERWQHGQEPAF